MNRTPFEHIEQKMREAAENIQPPLSDEAWLKMNRLLDQQKNRKKPAAGFWLWSILLLLITAGFGVYFYTRPTAPVSDLIVKTNVTANENALATPSQGSPTDQQSVIQKKISPAPPLIKKKDDATEKSNPAASEKAKNPVVNKKVVAHNQQKVKNPVGKLRKTNDELSDIVIPKKKDQQLMSNQEKQRNRNLPAVDRGRFEKEEKAKSQIAADQVISPTNGNKKFNALQDSILSHTIPKDQLTTHKKPAAEDKEMIKGKQELPVADIATRFYIIASIATDGNAVKGTAIKQATVMYGIGVGYRFNKRFSIQTGLYAGSKKYTADASSYYLKPGYWRMVNIKSIVADCYVFNVPLTVRYNITKGRQGRLYATGGISSYFIQKETYDYYYSYASNDSIRRRKEIFGDNTNLFSVLDFSIGYEHKISEHFSLQGEPYFKLPLKGIGEGKVQLYSAGFMLGLKFRP